MKVNGERAYKLAREGKKVELPARPVTIYELEITEIAPPFLSMTVTCSAGTYIRALGRDLGKEAGCLLTMCALIRTEMGPFSLKDARTLGEIEKDPEGAVISDLHPVLSALPALELSERKEPISSRGKGSAFMEKTEKQPPPSAAPVSWASRPFPKHNSSEKVFS